MLAAAGVSIGSILIPYIIGQASEQSDRAKVYMQVMSEREKADTAIRQEMFKTLLTSYLGKFEDSRQQSESQDSFRKRIMFLDLLNLNFHEYLNARPLFEDVSVRLQAKKKEKKGSAEYEAWEKLQNELIRVAKTVASNQLVTLASSGHIRTFSQTKGQVFCIRLYPVDNLWELSDKFEKHPLPARKDEHCSDATVQNPQKMDNGSPAIEVELADVYETAVRVKLTPYQESFKNKTLNFVRAGKTVLIEVSYFDLPYTDNVRLSDGRRFALLLSDIGGKEDPHVEFNAVIFKGDFMSLRDRPMFEEMLQKLSKDSLTH
jgi:hypothetical protein